jgi:DNA-binding transcriptional regulator YiaG
VKTLAHPEVSRTKSSARGKARARRASAIKDQHKTGPKSVSAQRTMTAVEIKELREKIQLSQERLARLVGTSWVTISRWERKRGTPSGEPEMRLGRLVELVSRIGNALPAGKIYDFLETPQAEFRGHRPVELLSSDYAFQDLLSFVDSAKSGDMA